MSNSNSTPQTPPSPSPTDPIPITNGLSLSPRIKLLLTIHRSDTTVSNLDEWKLKRSLIDFLKSSFSHPITVPDHDLLIRRFKDLKKRKREDPVARGSLFIRDLGFVVASVKGLVEDDDDVVLVLEKKFLEWRKVLVEKMNGMEVNLEGVKFRVTVEVPVSDDFQRMNKEWEDFLAFGDGANRGYSRSARQEPDTIVLRGLPSRWFAEPRVSSKPSMLVTHTIFSIFGKIRNLNVAEDDDLGKDTDEGDGDIVSGLHCKVVVQFEKYKEFYSALNLLSSRSLEKEGSRMKADYEVTWDRDGFFQSSRRHVQESIGRLSGGGAPHYKHEGPRRPAYSSRYSPDDVRAKRFKE